MTDEQITRVLAYWGAVLSTWLAILALVREFREDGRLRIRVWVGEATSSDSIRPYCMFEVVNVGRRPTFFKSLILHDGRGNFVAQVLGPIDDTEYIKLEPGQACETQPVNTYDDMDRILRIRRIFAVDPRRGRTYLARMAHLEHAPAGAQDSKARRARSSSRRGALAPATRPSSAGRPLCGR